MAISRAGIRLRAQFLATLQSAASTVISVANRIKPLAEYKGGLRRGRDKGWHNFYLPEHQGHISFFPLIQAEQLNLAMQHPLISHQLVYRSLAYYSNNYGYYSSKY